MQDNSGLRKKRQWWLSQLSLRGLIFLVLLTSFLLFLYFLGNFQEFLERTQTSLLLGIQYLSYGSLALSLFTLGNLVFTRELALGARIFRSLWTLFFGGLSLVVFLFVRGLFTIFVDPGGGL